MTLARDNAASHAVPAAFIVGDAAHLPVPPGSVHVCTALDSLVYVPEKRAAFDEMATVIDDGGLVALSDLIRGKGLTETDRTAVEEFADAWDMPPLVSLDQYRHLIEGVGFTTVEVHDISRHSVARLRKWTGLYLRLVDNGVGNTVARLIRRHGLDMATITEQIRRAHTALPHLRHVTIYARSG